MVKETSPVYNQELCFRRFDKIEASVTELQVDSGRLDEKITTMMGICGDLKAGFGKLTDSVSENTRQRYEFGGAWKLVLIITMVLGLAQGIWAFRGCFMEKLLPPVSAVRENIEGKM